MLFYRVEHRTNIDNGHFEGPYKGRASVGDMGWAHADDAHIALQFEQFSPIIPRKKFKKLCGFVTLDALLAWFDGWERDLIATGHVVRVYDVPIHKLYFGKQQVVAAKKYVSAKVTPVKVFERWPSRDSCQQ